jgi:hypothetical protein
MQMRSSTPALCLNKKLRARLQLCTSLARTVQQHTAHSLPCVLMAIEAASGSAVGGQGAEGQPNKSTYLKFESPNYVFDWKKLKITPIKFTELL